MARRGEEVISTQLETDIPGLSEKLLLLETPWIEISGSDIRKRVMNGEEFRYFIPDKIYHYVLNHKLYQS
jgi:nicotinate-nucleotide adenylyltransferase